MISKKTSFKKLPLDLNITLIWGLLLVVSIIAIIVFGKTVLDINEESSLKKQMSDHSSAIASQVKTNYQATTQKVNNTISSVLAEQSEDDNLIIQSIKEKLPNALRVLINNQNLVDITPEAFPGINYATLDMLKIAKKDNKNPVAEIHLYGQKDQYLNFIHILDNQSDRYLIISLPVDEILRSLPQLNVTNGYIVLKQTSSQFVTVRLKSWGNLSNAENQVSNSYKVENSYFSIDSSFPEPSYLLKGMTMMSAIIGMLSSILLLVAVVLNILKKLKELKQKQSQQPQSVYIPKARNEITDLGSGENNSGSTTSINKPENIPAIPDMKETNQIDKSIFRAYDIRGIVDEVLTTDAVRLIGQAIGTENLNRGKNSIVVARDGRLSGKKLLEALVEGLLKSGCNVINIGAVPTGVLYFATHHLEVGSGVMLTGSHNPPNYNGLKIMLNGETLSGELIMDLYYSIINNDLATGDASEQKMDIADDYVDYISSDIQLDDELKVVVDCGNGIGGEVGPQVLEEIGCEVIPLHCEIDGSFPNHHPDPSVPENLQDLITAVKSTDADIGIAFDGDADRLGVVTKSGEIIYPDRLLMLFAKDVLIRQPGASIIFDVKCTGHLPKEIVKNGGLPIIWKTGHSFIKAKIKETNAALAGEMSGHFFFNERWYGFDDGIYAAARLLEILDQEGRPAQDVFDELPNSVSTPELKCHTQEGENYAFMEKFQKSASFPDAHLTTIDGIRADFADGWGLVRCSNTTPCLVLRFDADNEEALNRIKEEFREQILKVDDTLKLPF